MAYIGHSSFRDVRELTHSLTDLSLLARCGLVAIAAAAAVIALSSAGPAPVEQAATVVATKGDRLAAPQIMALQPAAAGIVHDVAARTTTIERGATAPLSSASPLLAGSK